MLQKDGAPLPADRFAVEDGRLSIAAVAEEDRGVLVCTASNEAADVSAETELLIENLPPRAPHALEARASAHALHVRWAPGRRGDAAEYTLWYRERAAREWRTLRLLTRGATEATLAGLRAATPHELRVLAQDPLGDGLFSRPLVVSTLGPPPRRRAAPERASRPSVPARSGPPFASRSIPDRRPARTAGARSATGAETGRVPSAPPAFALDGRDGRAARRPNARNDSVVRRHGREIASVSIYYDVKA